MKISILIIIIALLPLNMIAQGKDSIPPTITILGGDTLKWEVLIPFKDPGVKLKDDSTSDGALIKRIIIKTNVNISKTDTYQVQYDVKDLAGNAAKTKIRTVMVIDTVKPIISLKGDPSQSIEKFGHYVDPGYNLSDNYDRPTHIKITTEGSFKQNKPKNTDSIGIFKFRYIATDTHGNVGYSDDRYILVKPIEVSIQRQTQSLFMPIIFPNPANEQINIEFKHTISGNVIISLTDELGRQINLTSQALLNNKAFQIPTSNLPNGIYFLNIQSSQGYIVEKIEIRH